MVQEIKDALGKMVAAGELSGVITEASDRSEAVYLTACRGRARFQVRVARHPVSRPGPQFLLGDHPGADSSSVTDAIEAVARWINDVKDFYER